MKTATNSLRPFHPFLKLDYRIKEANALSRTTIAVYEALLWFQREKDDCFPGYEKLKKRAKINSKTTLSLHLKVLCRIGLITRKRRGKKQSNVYKAVKADQLTSAILSNLKRPHKSILAEIAHEDVKARNIRLAKRELHEKKYIRHNPQKVPQQRTYPQSSEVQLLDFHRKAFQASRSSSNRHNDSKIENGREKRGGGFTPIVVYLQAAQHMPISQPRGSQKWSNAPGGEQSPIKKQSPQESPFQPLTTYARIREVVCKISTDIRDPQHALENASQAINLFKNVRQSRKISVEGFIQSLLNARGLTLEIICLLDRPGAYYFVVLRNMWQRHVI